MNKIILTLAAVSTLTATAAVAQPGYGYDSGRDRAPVYGPDYGRDGRDFGDYGRPGFAQPGVQIDAKQARLAQRIEFGVRNGSLSWREAMRLRMELREIERIEAQFRYSRPGLTRVEMAHLDNRLDRLSMQIRFERHDRDNRQYGQGYGRW